MEGTSGTAKAGTILLLVGGIVGVVFGVGIAVLGVVLLTVGRNVLGGDTPSTFPSQFVGILYIVLGSLQAIGSIFAFLGFGRARRGDIRGGWVMGLVAGLLPPVQLLPLIGAILCLVSPEAKEGQA